MSRRVIWPGTLGTISGDHLSREIHLRVRIDDSIPAHGGRTVRVTMDEREARLAIRQLTNLLEHLNNQPTLEQLQERLRSKRQGNRV